jgi:hypothetical protein
MSLFADYKKERERKDVLEWDHGFAVYSFPDESTCYFEDLYVSPEKRKTMYWFRLTKEVELIARLHGCKILVGSVATNAAFAHDNVGMMLKYGYRISQAKENMIYFVKEL